MMKYARCFSAAGLRFALLVSVLFLATSFQRCTADDSWEFTPYNIELKIDISADPIAAKALSEELPRALRNHFSATAGPLWKLKIKEEQFPQEWTDEKPPALLNEDFPGEWIGLDKIFLLRVNKTSDRYSLQAREFDVATRQWGPLVSSFTRQNKHLPRIASRAIRSAFSPLAIFRLNPKDKSRVLLTVKGAKIQTASKESLLLQAGDVLAPIVRLNKSDGQPKEKGGIIAVPWTYMVVEQDKKGQLDAAIISGVRSPFGARRRGRAEQYGLLAKPIADATTLQLVGKSKTQPPLAGCRIYERKEKDKGKGFDLIGVSDKDGLIIIPHSKAKVRMLWVKSGNFLLAKVPVVPGHHISKVVPLVDDEARLQAEGQVSAIQNELKDVIARRSLIIAKIRARILLKQFDKASKLSAQLDELKNRKKFNFEIMQKKNLASTSDKRANKRIEKMFDDTLVLLGRFLGSQEISTIQRELDDAKRGIKKEGPPTALN